MSNKAAYKWAGRSLTHALTIGDHASWKAVSLFWSAILPTQQRAALSWSALRWLEPEQIKAVAEALPKAGAGQPIAPLFSHMDEASFWADMAEPSELEAYCLASFNRMPVARQEAFLAFVKGRAAA